jgi:hypothetical protein
MKKRQSSNLCFELVIGGGIFVGSHGNGKTLSK